MKNKVLWAIAVSGLLWSFWSGMVFASQASKEWVRAIEWTPEEPVTAYRVYSSSGTGAYLYMVCAKGVASMQLHIAKQKVNDSGVLVQVDANPDHIMRIRGTIPGGDSVIVPFGSADERFYREFVHGTSIRVRLERTGLDSSFTLKGAFNMMTQLLENCP